MNSILALEELIKKNEERINHHQQQLANHEAGTAKLSRLSKASAETNLETALERIEQYKAKLLELGAEDQEELKEKERVEEAIKRKKYFDDQLIRIKKNKGTNEDEKLEAMRIIDELPNDVHFEDDILIDIANKSLELNLSNHKELFEKLTEIRSKFESMLESNEDDQLKELSMLNFQIPILILHFHALSENILYTIEKTNISRKESSQDSGEEYEELVFKGFPKYEDWWIHELWSSHQGYFALYKWKQIIENLCITNNQKRGWKQIFDSWLFIKKQLNDKGAVAFEINYSLDSLLYEYTGVEEETINNNLVSMETIINKITQKEDFTTVSQEHNVVTPYLRFKRGKEQ